MISLLIPFASHDQRRIMIFEWVTRRWAHLFTDWQLCVGMSEEENFNRSEARNKAFERSKGDILVLSDADTACTAECVLAAIQKVQQGAPWVVAHDRYYSLTKEYTDQLLLQPPTVNLCPPFESDWIMKERSMAGVLVMPRAAWEHVNGYDERFQGWGYEDNEFAIRMDRRWGPHQRVRGPMLHLWHERGDADFSQPNIQFNEHLYQETVRHG